jgi:hypothetical protein
MLAGLIVPLWYEYEAAKRGDIHRPYAKGERKRRGLEWDRKDIDLEGELRRAYEEITGELAPTASIETVQAASEAVSAFSAQAETSEQSSPVADNVNWAALAADAAAVRALIAAYDAAIDEDEAITAILLIV